MSLKEKLKIIHKNWYVVNMSKSKFTVARSQQACLPAWLNYCSRMLVLHRSYSSTCRWLVKRCLNFCFILLWKEINVTTSTVCVSITNQLWCRNKGRSHYSYVNLYCPASQKHLKTKHLYIEKNKDTLDRFRDYSGAG